MSRPPDAFWLAFLDRLHALAVKTDQAHARDHFPCDHPTFEEWVEKATAQFRAELTPDPDEEEKPEVPDNLSKDQRYRLRKKWGVTRPYGRQTTRNSRVNSRP